jgi:hypothetical protein
MIKKEFLAIIEDLEKVDHNTIDPKEYGRRLRKQFIKAFGFKPERVFGL